MLLGTFPEYNDPRNFVITLRCNHMLVVVASLPAAADSRLAEAAEVPGHRGRLASPVFITNMENCRHRYSMQLYFYKKLKKCTDLRFAVERTFEKIKIRILLLIPEYNHQI